MKRHIKKYFIPHEDNDHKPHILREVGIVVLALIAIASFAFSALHAAILLHNTDFIAAVFPSVLVDLANDDREDNGVLPLTVNPVLEEAAQLKAEHMAEHGYFSHVSPDGTTPWHWFAQAGYQFTHAGENLAVNFVDSVDVERAWMDSPGHRDNILNGAFTEVGIATAEGEYEGRETVFVVQLFGRPAPTRVAQVPTPGPTVAEASTETQPEPAVQEQPEPLPEAPVQEPQEVDVVVETDTFIAVQTTGNELAQVSDNTVAEPQDEEALGVGATGLVEDQSTFFERLASQPREILQWIYIILGAIIVLVLTATVLVEVEKQHPKHVAYGLLLLILLLVLVYINREFIFADLLVV